jgi:hypothetical protein
MRVLIVGAGIAGLTLSALLRQKGIKPQIVDRASDFAQAGYMLGLFPMGNRVLHGLGARDSSRASSSRCKGRSRHRSLPPARGPTLVDETIGRLCRGADGRRAFSCSFGARAWGPPPLMSAAGVCHRPQDSYLCFLLGAHPSGHCPGRGAVFWVSLTSAWMSCCVRRLRSS